MTGKKAKRDVEGSSLRDLPAFFKNNIDHFTFVSHVNFYCRNSQVYVRRVEFHLRKGKPHRPLDWDRNCSILRCC